MSKSNKLNQKMDNKIKRKYKEKNVFLSKLGKKVQYLNCKFIKKNHKFAVHNKVCMRCDYVKPKNRVANSESTPA